MRPVQYYFLSFMEVDNHTITIGPLPFENSSTRSTLAFSGTKRLVSSAYLNNKFMSEMQRRSLAITIHKVGLIPDTCIILRVMGCIAENRPSVVLQTWVRSVKNAIIPFKTEDGKSRALSLDNIMAAELFRLPPHRSGTHYQTQSFRHQHFSRSSTNWKLFYFNYPSFISTVIVVSQ